MGKSIARWTEKGDQLVTAIPGLSLSRRDAPTQPTSYMYEPSMCLIAQGAKRVLLGDDTYVFDAHHFLITSVDLPTVVQIIQASREKPYLSLLLKLDQREMAQLMVDSHLPPPRAQQSSRGMATGEVTLPLLTAFQRLIDLLAAPQDIPILAPIIQREILYRLLVGEQGARLRQMASAGSQSHQIARAIEWLKRHFTLPVTDRGPRSASPYESIDLPPSLSGADGHESAAVPKMVAVERSAAVDAHGAPGCSDRGVSGRL